MKWLKVEYIKTHLRIDFDCDDALLEQYALGAEETILALLNRTYENLIDSYGEVPAPIVNASLLLVGSSYQNREPASAQNLSAVPYGVDYLLKPYALLAGTPSINERNHILDAIQEQKTNIDFFAAEDTSETKDELISRITTMWKKFHDVSQPTTMILESMRKQLASLQADVKNYLESINQA